MVHLAGAANRTPAIATTARSERSEPVRSRDLTLGSPALRLEDEILEILPLILRRHAAQRGDETAVTFLSGRGEIDGSLTFGELDRRARAIAAALQRHAEPGARAVLLLKPGLSLLCAFIGCQYAGVIAVPLQPPAGLPLRGRDRQVRARKRLRSSLHRFAVITEDARAALVLSSADLAEQVTDVGELAPPLAAATWIAVDEVGDDLPASWRQPEWRAEDLSLLQYTSGSTADPKGVAVAHRHLVSNAMAIRQLSGQEPSDLCVNWLPPTHDMGLIGTFLHALFLGVPQIQFSPTTFLKRPLIWLKTISENAASLTVAPNFAFDLCVDKSDRESRKGLDLSSLRVVVVGAEPIRAATMSRFARTFEPYGLRAEAFSPCYGLAESTLIVTGRRAIRAVSFGSAALRSGEAKRVGDSAGDAVQLVSCGRPLGDAEVRIVDPETLAILPEGRVGEICVASSHVAAGYFGHPQISAEVFGAKLRQVPGKTFLRTGDAGVIHDGELFVTGRYKDVMIFGGANHHPHDVEGTVAGVSPALRDGRVVAFSLDSDGEERLVVGVDLRGLPGGERRVVCSEIRESVLAEHGLHVYALVALNAGALTRTTSGKPQRYLARQRYVAGELGEVL